MRHKAPFSAAIIIAGALAARALAAPAGTTLPPIPTIPDAVGTAADAALPLAADQGNPVDVTPVVNGALQIGNAALGGAHAAEDAASPFAGASPLGAGGLAGTQGGSNVNINANIVAAISDNDLNAVNTGNSISANTITNGAVNIGTNAFSGFSGIGNFLMNTGNQNNIEGTLSVDIVAAPASH
jgi:hypothetical protein